MKTTVFVPLVLAALAAAPAALAAQPGRPPGAGVPGAPASAGLIQGSVQDAASGRPVGSASVAVWSAADSVLVDGALSRADGGFRIDGLRPGRYVVRVSHVGYAGHRSEVTLAPGRLQADLGVVRLAASTVALQGLTVTGERSQVALAPDRSAYTVRDLPAASGGTASDVLRNVPSVEVDVDGRVSLRGNQNVVVQINGRSAPMRGEQLAQYLQQLPASLVERVEVVPNPSAKQDPEGMAGIVNLVLKQNTSLGTSGGLQLGAGTGGRLNASGNLGYQQGALTLFGSYGLYVDERETSGFNYRENRYLDPLTYLRQDIEGSFDGLSHHLNGSAELKLGKRDVVASSVLLSQRGGENGSRSLLAELDAASQVTQRTDQLTHAENDDLNFDYALSFTRAFAPRTHELELEARFNRSRFGVDNEFLSQRLTPGGTPADDQPERETNRLDAQTDHWTLQADYTRPLGAAGAKLETGYKGTLRRLDNDAVAARFSYAQGGFVPDPRRTSDFAFDEQVHAAYAVATHRLGRFDLQGGLRLESATSDFRLAGRDETYENDYTSLFPSGLLAYNLSEQRQLKASYSKRIQRPDARLLNPLAFYEDPLNVFRGNPSLQPEYTHAFELGYQQNGQWGTLQVTPFFRRTVDAVRRIRSVDSVGVATTTFRNAATSDSYGADLNGSWRLGVLSGFAGLSAFKVVTDAGNLGEDLSTNAFAWSLRGNATWRVTPKLDVQGFAMYRAPMEIEGGRISSMQMMHLALRQKVLRDQGSVGLRLVDPFDRMRFAYETRDARHHQESERRFGARSLFLTFSYNFGRPPRLQQRPQPQQPELDVPSPGPIGPG